VTGHEPADSDAGGDGADPGFSDHLGRLRRSVTSPGTRSLASVGLLVLAGFYTLYFARAILLPISLAVLLTFLLGPLVAALARRGVPRGLGAALVILLLVGTIGFGAYRLYEPASEWIEKAPRSIHRIEHRIQGIKEPAEKVSQARKEVEKLTDVDSGGSDRTVTVEAQPAGDSLVSRTWALLVSAVILVALLYFMLATGDAFLRKLVRTMPTLHDKRQAVRVARRTQHEISVYLYAVSLINLAQGAVVALVLHLLDFPNPVLWGVVAALLNYVPYLGPAAMTLLLSGAAVLTFDDLTHAALVPAAYLLLHVAEAYLVTPWLLGRRLTLNTVVLLIGVLFWGWIWGLAGALMAVPLMATVKILCDHIEPLRPIGELMGP